MKPAREQICLYHCRSSLSCKFPQANLLVVRFSMPLICDSGEARQNQQDRNSRSSNFCVKHLICTHAEAVPERQRVSSNQRTMHEASRRPLNGSPQPAPTKTSNRAILRHADNTASIPTPAENCPTPISQLPTKPQITQRHPAPTKNLRCQNLSCLPTRQLRTRE